jgi:hypothetical protein
MGASAMSGCLENALGVGRVGSSRRGPNRSILGGCGARSVLSGTEVRLPNPPYLLYLQVLFEANPGKSPFA